MDAIEKALLDLSGEVFSTGPAYLREGASRRILSTLVREARVGALREVEELLQAERKVGRVNLFGRMAGRLVQWIAAEESGR